MLNKYYYAKQGLDYIIYEAKNKDNAVQMSLFLNETLIESKTGLLGEYELTGDNITLKIKNSAFKSTHNLNYKGSTIELQKIKLKNLRNELAESNIFNEINPTKAQITANKFKVKSLLIPAVLMAIGISIQFFVKDMSKSYQLIALFPEALAGWILYDITSARSLWVSKIRKGRIGYMALVIVILGLLGEFLF